MVLLRIDAAACATSTAAKPSEFRKNRAGLSEGSTALYKGGDIPVNFPLAGEGKIWYHTTNSKEKQ